MSTQTKGQYRVGASFNPSKDVMVDQIKAKAAELIDLVETIHTGLNEPTSLSTGCGLERVRLKALAQTAFEDGAMWAVKAATKPDPAA